MLQPRAWVPDVAERRTKEVVARTASLEPQAVIAEVERLAKENHRIHDEQAINLNPATNVMNPRAEALLSSGIGTRPSLGYPGDKYEMGLEAIEEIEVIAAELAAEVFNARFVELRVPSGALANLYVFMACCKAGDAIIVPPPSIGGHVTHQAAGAAGLYGLQIHEAPVEAAGYTVDVTALRRLAQQIKPRLISLGGSLNLFPHPIVQLRAIADEVGAKLLFDAAHLSGVIAGKAWQQPLQEGAHAMTMSTYKSLGGPPSGLIVTNDAEMAQRLDAIAYPGLTANFDAAKTAALAVTLADWKALGRDYAAKMLSTAKALAEALAARGLAVHGAARGFTTSHQLALEAAPLGGGQTAAKRLRRANLLACGIGLPIASVAGDLNGLRLGTPEIVRLGFGPEQMPALAALIDRALRGNEAPETVAAEVTQLRADTFKGLRYVL